MTISNGTTDSPSQSPNHQANGVGNSTVAKEPKLKGLGHETLCIVQTPIEQSKHTAPKSRILLEGVDGYKYLPGQPRIALSSPPGVDGELVDYLRKAHLTTELDRLLPFMKYIFVQTPSFRHIMPLHHQVAHAREIIVDEYPGLHLVWYYGRIFVKPIPTYFYSQAFWNYLSSVHNQDDEDIHAAAIGFMRSYYFLIQYEIDFTKACELKLIPKLPGSDEHPTYDEFCRFMDYFKEVKDDKTCRRYHYGELRLTRINRTSLFMAGRLAYFHIYPQWGSYLRHFLAPIIVALGGFSVVLNAMQVTLNAQEMLGDTSDGSPGLSPNWTYFTKTSLYFPVVIITWIAGIVALGVLGVLIMALKDLVWAKKTRRKKKAGHQNAGDRSHGVIW